MRGELERILIFIYNDMDKMSKKDLHQAIEDRILVGSINHRLNGGTVGTLRKMRNSVNKFSDVFNEVVVDLTKALSKSKDLENQRKYRSNELADIFGLSDAAVCGWYKNGHFPNAIKDGRKVIIPESDIDLFVEKRPKYKTLWEEKK